MQCKDNRRVRGWIHDDFHSFDDCRISGIESLVNRYETKGILAKILGRTKESISESLYTKVSRESIENSVISEIGYKYKYESFNKTDSYVFHGSTERGAARKGEV